MLIPYHLRARKEIDRGIFLDVLHAVAVQQWDSPASAVYVGMGAETCEDFVAVYDRFGVERMFSIEEDEVTHARQGFNLPLSRSCLISRKASVGEFLTNHFERGEQPHIVWLDYDNSDKRHRQLDEFRRFLGKLQAGDVAKITLSVPNAPLMREASWETTSVKDVERAMGILRRQLEGYFPKDIDAQKVLTTKGEGAGPILLRSAILAAGDAEIPGFRPLNALLYSDSERTEMLTLTGVLIDESNGAFNAPKVPFPLNDGGIPHRIDPPIITPCEKIAMDKFLPAKSEEELKRAHDILFRRGLKFEKGKNESLARFKRYAEFHRYYPDYRNIRP